MSATPINQLLINSASQDNQISCLNQISLVNPGNQSLKLPKLDNLNTVVRLDSPNMAPK